jgi:hypothetical protein
VIPQNLAHERAYLRFLVVKLVHLRVYKKHQLLLQILNLPIWKTFFQLVGVETHLFHNRFINPRIFVSRHRQAFSKTPRKNNDPEFSGEAIGHGPKSFGHWSA